jgi:hypothetical protein
MNKYDEYDSWILWEDKEPDQCNSGSIEALYYYDGLPIIQKLYLYHYATGESKWGYSNRGESGDWKTFHPKFYKWRYINGTIPSAIQQSNSILVWRWNDAPGELRSHSTHGGDEDWVALIPKDIEIPSWMDCEPFSICRMETEELDDGRRVVITAHA